MFSMGLTLHQHSHGHGHSHSHDHGHDHSHKLENGKALQVHETEAEKAARNINVRAAFIHVLGDLIQSLGVFIAALVIYYEV